MQTHSASGTLRLLAVSAIVLSAGLAGAGDAAPVVVARTGEHTITAAAIERRLAGAPSGSHGL